MSESEIEKLQSVARQLEHLSIRLGASVPPGHVNYISKPAASSWATVLCKDIRKLLVEESDIDRPSLTKQTNESLGVED